MPRLFSLLLVLAAGCLAQTPFFPLQDVKPGMRGVGKTVFSGDRVEDADRIAYLAAHLGEVLWKQGKKAEAERVWRESLHENPDSDELLKVINKFIP